MVKDSEQGERRGEFQYAEKMSEFFRVWIRRSFGMEFDVRCDEMVTRGRGVLDRLDTHTVLRDHRSRGEETYHFYLCHFRPMWTDCTCEGYHAENFGMIYWQRGDDELFLAEKNCAAVSHELAHELLRQKRYGRYTQDVHDVWTRHFHAGLPFEQYGGDFEKTDGRPVFLTMDVSGFGSPSTL